MLWHYQGGEKLVEDELGKWGCRVLGHEKKTNDLEIQYVAL